MNKKTIFLVIILICLVIGIIYISRTKEKDVKTNTNEISKEEYESSIISKTKEKIENTGIRLTGERKVKNRINNLEGYSYKIISEENEQLEIQIYIINLKDKRDIFEKDIQNGKVEIKDGNDTIEGILKDNILITNITDDKLMEKIMSALEIK